MQTNLDSSDTPTTLRIDKWLWYARFFKTRTLASKVCNAGKVRVNSTPISKAKSPVKPGDVLTFPQGNQIRVIKILALGERRGPAPEAQTLYEDQTPPAPSKEETYSKTHNPARPKGEGRPTKADRRAMDKLKGN